MARETAAMEYWSREPSIMVSEAPTKETMRLWKAMGRAKENRFFRNVLSLKVDLRRFFSILYILLF